MKDEDERRNGVEWVKRFMVYGIIIKTRYESPLQVRPMLGLWIRLDLYVIPDESQAGRVSRYTTHVKKYMYTLLGGHEHGPDASPADRTMHYA
jgi:hypothetical protein